MRVYVYFVSMGTFLYATLGIDSSEDKNFYLPSVDKTNARTSLLRSQISNISNSVNCCAIYVIKLNGGASNNT